MSKGAPLKLRFFFALLITIICASSFAFVHFSNTAISVVSRGGESTILENWKPNKGLIPLHPDYFERKKHKEQQIAWADSILASMSLEEKVGQLFMISAYSNRSEAQYVQVENLIKNYHVGGIVFFQGTADKQLELTQRYQSLSSIPLMIGMDAEWGLGMRLSQTMSFPKQITLGAIKDLSLIEEMGYEIGRQCRRIGVTVNFAPVSDVNTNPKNPVINYRSFGESPNEVAERAKAYARGLKRAGVMAVAKHFPGHGDTDTDSHVAMPIVNQSKEHLSTHELVPFRELINAEIGGVMIGHLHVPALDNRANTPATVSEKVIKTLLKEQMGFNGLTFTDALNMKGITTKYGAGGADFEAYKAGNDILLQTANLPVAFNKILNGVKSGQLSAEELDAHVHKILSAKFDLGLTAPQQLDENNLYADLHTPEASFLIDRLFKQAVTLLRVQPATIPFIQLDTLSIGAVAVSAPVDNEMAKSLNNYADIVNYKMPIKPGSSSDWDFIVKQADVLDVMVVSIHDMNSNASRNFGVSPSTLSMIRELQKHTKVIVVPFCNPYALRIFDEFPNVICGFEDDPGAYKAVSEILFGATSAAGHLPVTTSPKASFNFGNMSANLGRLATDVPENAGMSSQMLKRVGVIAEQGIREGAYPGCQILVARRGKVVYHQAFGNYRYGFKEPVTTETIYDLASLTKVSATLQAIMMLNEKGWLDLNLKASDYLPELKGTNKEDMVIADLLMHQAGLKAFIPFWINTKTERGQFLTEFYTTKPGEKDLQVAPDLYIKPIIKDSVWQWLIDSELTTRVNASGTYRYLYSDLGLIMLQHVVEKITGQPLDEYLEANLYEPLGMSHTLFNPLQKYPKDLIAPTENDGIFRQEQVWGTVHDPNAALLGGVAGHAGLFSNAWDLAKLYQMNMQKGVYGGRRYLFNTTVPHFAKNYTNLSHRGLGWNKPDGDPTDPHIAAMASDNTFGHTGFTGTVVWVDPNEQLIFIMLSNRVYPRDNNTKLIKEKYRKRIHEAVYEAIK